MDGFVEDLINSVVEETSMHTFNTNHAINFSENAVGGSVGFLTGGWLGMAALGLTPVGLPYLLMGSIATAVYGQRMGSSTEFGVKSLVKGVIGSVHTSISNFFDDYQEHLEKGYKNFENQDFDIALQNFSRVIELNKNCTEAYFLRGFIYSGAGYYDEALADFSQVIELEPNSIRAYESRAYVYFAKKQYLAAIFDYRKLIDNYPNNLEALFYRGYSHLQLKEYQSALKDFSKIINLEPNHINARLNRCLIYLELENYEKVLEDYEEAIKLDISIEADVYEMKLDALVELKRYKEAIKFCNDLIENCNDFNLKLYTTRAFLRCEIKAYELAVDDYSKIIDKQPDDLELYKTRANLRCKLKQYGLAIIDYSKIIDKQPDDLELYKTRANLRCKLKQYGLAIIDYSKIIDKQPNNKEILLARIECNRKINKMQEVIDDLKVIIDNDKSKINYYLDLIEAHKILYKDKKNGYNKCIAFIRKNIKKLDHFRKNTKTHDGRYRKNISFTINQLKELIKAVKKEKNSKMPWWNKDLF